MTSALTNQRRIFKACSTLFLPAMGGISPYMSVTWPSPVGIGLSQWKFNQTSMMMHFSNPCKFKYQLQLADFKKWWLSINSALNIQARFSQKLWFSPIQFVATVYFGLCCALPWHTERVAICNKLLPMDPILLRWVAKHSGEFFKKNKTFLWEHWIHTSIFLSFASKYTYFGGPEDF